MERFAIGADFEGAAAGWNQGERRDAIAKIENFSRQTDGFRCVVSNAAKLDPDFGFHRSLLSCDEPSGMGRRVKATREMPALRALRLGAEVEANLQCVAKAYRCARSISCDRSQQPILYFIGTARRAAVEMASALHST